MDIIFKGKNDKIKRRLVLFALTSAAVLCTGFVDSPEAASYRPGSAIYVQEKGRLTGDWLEALRPISSSLENGSKIVKAKPEPARFTEAAMSTSALNRVELVSMDVPSVDTSFKAYMDYRAITNRNSPQWRMQQQAATDELGLRKIGEDYMVALGTYYAKGCGERFRVTFSSGKTINVVVGDIKSDRHTNATRQYCPRTDGSGNLIEFIVDSRTMAKEARRMGDVSCLGFSGTVASIEKIVQ